MSLGKLHFQYINNLKNKDIPIVDILYNMDTYMIDNTMRASSIIDYECGDDIILMMVYCVIFAVDKNYIVELCDEIIEHQKFRLRDFIIERNTEIC